MDHVPPKGIFINPRPALVTVPACERCNGGASRLDEEFKVFLSLRVGVDSDAAKEFWHRGALPSIRNNHRLFREILGGPKVMVENEGGALVESVAFHWDAESYGGTIGKITRGLYWHEYGEILPPDAQVKTYFFEQLDDDLHALAMSLKRRNIGGDERFVYAFGRGEDGPVWSIWLYQFYKGHWGAAFTSPAGERDADGEQAPA